MKEILKAKNLNIILIFLYAISGILFPFIYPNKCESYAICATANIPLITAWMGIIWLGNKDKIKYANGETQKKRYKYHFV